jgi:SAM domain (Sterile alpha motif)/Adenylate and Guanylate cyclase catalytic domain
VPRHPRSGPFGSISRGTIYRLKSPVQRVHKAEFRGAWAAMQEIADWLTRLGLPEYAGAFAENGIDVSVLPHLTDQDLKDIGVLLGHRRKILAAVAELPGKSQSASRPFPPLAEARDRHTTDPPHPAPVALRPTEAMGERRHVTVMFCDLVDSTGIAAKLDAEEWRDLVGAYIDAASAAVVEMGGKVAKKLGDGLMALFGYPVAQENDAERAVRAALAIQRSLADLNRKNAGTGNRRLPRGSRSSPGRWWWMHRAKSSATCRTSRRGRRRWPNRAL